MTGLLTGCLLLTACGSDTRTETPTAAEPPLEAPQAPNATAETPAASNELSALNMEQWARSCALCHVRGEGGAPVLGDAAAWASRREQGEDVLLQHTVEGLNNMPPLGYCMDCEEADFRTLIRFMGGAL